MKEQKQQQCDKEKKEVKMVSRKCTVKSTFYNWCTQYVHKEVVHAVIRNSVFIKITSVDLFDDCVHLYTNTVPYILAFVHNSRTNFPNWFPHCWKLHFALFVLLVANTIVMSIASFYFVCPSFI